MSGFGFGSGSSGNNPSSAGPSFMFGNKPAVPTTGLGLGGTTSTPGSLFGGTGNQPTFGSSANTLPSFGATASQTGSGLFGSSTLGQSTGTSFGSLAVSTASSGMFGSSAFGAQPTSAPTFVQPSLSFGTSTSGGSLSFGIPAGGGTVSFGLPLPPAQPVMSLGTPTASVAPLSFGPSTTTSGFGSTLGGHPTGLGFGAPNMTATSTSLPFGTTSASTGFGVNSTSTSLGFQGFGATPATTAAKPLGLSFGTTPASTGTGLSLGTPSSQAAGFGLGGSSLSMGLFGSVTSKPLGLGTSTASLSFGATTTSAATTPSLGLGGIDTSQNKAGQSGLGAGRSDNVKENQIPNEIVQTLENFKSFKKEQKSCSSDIARGSTKFLDKVRQDTESLKQMLGKLSTSLQKYRAQADHLKGEMATAMRDAEMAQRTHDTPPGLQYDNVAPLQFFTDLVASFEHEMHVFRQEIENTEKHITSLIEPRPLSPEELTTAMKRLHDSFVSLAGRLQTIHNSVEVQKDQYLNLRKYILKDSSEVFDSTKKPSSGFGKPVSTYNSLGPTPFLATGIQHGYGLHASSAAESSQIYTTGNPIGWGAGQMQAPRLLGSIGNPLASTGESQGFVLQKPPPGTKRGKR